MISDFHKMDTRGHQVSTDCKMIRGERIRHSNDSEITSGIVAESCISSLDDMPGSSTFKMKSVAAVNGTGRATPITPMTAARKRWTASVSAGGRVTTCRSSRCVTISICSASALIRRKVNGELPPELWVDATSFSENSAIFSLVCQTPLRDVRP